MIDRIETEALEGAEMPYRIFTDTSRVWLDDDDGGSLFAYVREGAASSAPAEVEALVKRLRERQGRWMTPIFTEAADRIEQLERELYWAKEAEKLWGEKLRSSKVQLTAEKALADELEKVAHGVSWDHPARTAYRKARGL